ncbi:MAG: phage recombination protein Bet [Sedimentisphaerales bacterium]|nr:phage recombination protein Bet [Sedimentisphaerales bacterium]
MSKKQNEQTSNDNLPAINGPRLPYHPAVEERFGIDRASWKALVEAIFPAAQSTESVILALSYCRARKLDPFKRCIHIVPIWDGQKRAYVDTVWPGIGELRTTAHRTKNYAGRDKTEFGPLQTQEWEGKDKKTKEAYRVEVTFPEWAQVTVYRLVNGQRVAHAGPQVFWLETFGEDRNGAPNSMWRKRPRGQIDKCAEAAALRSAFPEEVGNEYIDAEAHLSKQIDSREVEETDGGNEGLKKLLAERETNGKAEPHAETPEEPQADETAQNDETEPPDHSDERDEETEAKVRAEQEKLQAAAAGKGNGKCNLF